MSSRIKQFFLYIPVLGLIAAFAAHAVLGLLQDPEHVAIVSVLGLGPVATKWLTYAIFPLDGAVVLLLIFGDRIRAEFPWKWLFFWTGAWPWIPRYLEFIGGMTPEFGDAFGLTVLAVLSYYLYKKRGIVLLKRKIC